MLASDHFGENCSDAVAGMEDTLKRVEEAAGLRKLV
jgi:hypothetical protein